MPTVRPIPIKQRIKINRKRRKGNVIIAPPVFPSKAAEVIYRKALNELISEMIKDVKTAIVPVIQTYVKDNSFVVNIRNSIKGVTDKYKDITPYASIVASKMVTGENATQKRKLNAAIKAMTGLDLNRIISNEGLEPTLDAQIQQNVELIQSIPDQYFKEINRIVFSNMTDNLNAEGGLEGEILKILRRDGAELNKKIRNRAKLIARDQTSKTSAAINQTRQENLGVKEYVWQTSQDERVVGNPSGRYPRGNSSHGDHFKRNGETHSWAEPPHDGHPGKAIGCRCTARAVIEI